MARTAKALSPLEISRLTKPGIYFVGTIPGLALQVLDSGARSWILRAMVAGRRREMGLGGYPGVTVAGAWEAARAARAKIRAGIDPIEEARAARSTLAAERAAAITFEEAATKFIGAKEAEWKSSKHSAQWTNTLTTYAYPTIGKLHVAHVEQSHVMKILEPIWTMKPETASRLRGRIEAVLDWARVRGYRKGDNPARWKGHLDKLLASPKKTKAVEHHPALPYSQMGSFMADLRKLDGAGARALEFAILTAARSGEVRGASWAEIDLEAAIWTIPAERMKAKKEHRIPLSSQVVALLKSTAKTAGTDLVFTGAQEGKKLSDMSLTAVLRRMERKDITVHGFRSSFRDWAGETTAYPREVIEHALAHQLKDKAEAAYQRGTLLDKRRKLMQAWAAYCDKPTSKAGVTPINSLQAGQNN